MDVLGERTFGEYLYLFSSPFDSNINVIRRQNGNVEIVSEL